MGDRTTIVVASGEMDRLYSTLIIANGSLAMGMDVSLYFTFWGLERLKKGGLERGRLSRMHLAGLGKGLMRLRMKKARVASLERLMAEFRDLGGRIIACEMTMEIMGLSREDMRENLIDEYGAVGTYIRDARDSRITLLV
ncbi:MAG: DsrE/DsrF/DrsH-like family protein [Anaerolineae bacterium]|jgi:peroxiredoxin family protein|nr:NAD(FAD)-dependent dehydrogenase [Chloroflexota bacterium]